MPQPLAPLGRSAGERACLDLPWCGTAERTADEAARRGLSVFACPSIPRPDALPGLLYAAAERGLYALPALRIPAEGALLHGFFVDWRSLSLLAHLEKHGAEGAARPAEAIRRVLTGAGAAVLEAGHPLLEKDFSCARLGELEALLPSQSLHRNFFERLLWRSRNLTDAEFRASLSPERVPVNESAESGLLTLPAFEPVEPLPPGHPFVLAAPSVLSRLVELEHTLTAHGFAIQAHHDLEGYPRLAWQLYGFAALPEADRRKALLRFALDRHLFGVNARRCRVYQVSLPVGPSRRSLKQALRASLGEVRFYRIEGKWALDEAFSAWIHMSDEGQEGRECAVLRAHEALA